MNHPFSRAVNVIGGKERLIYLSFGALLLALMVTWMAEAEAAATCFCKISKNNLAGYTSSSGVCQDLTAQASLTFTGPFQQGEDNQQKCNNRCANIIQPLIHSQSVATACCALGTPSGTNIYAYSAVGTKAYRIVPFWPPNPLAPQRLSEF